LIKDLAREIGVTEGKVINWEVMSKIPRFESHIKTIKGVIPEAGRFFGKGKPIMRSFYLIY
jgi:hypothetical protein